LTSSFVDAPDVLSDVDLPELRAMLHPKRELWSARQLRRLTRRVSAELSTALLVAARYRSDQRWWARLALTSGVELWLLSWLPGQATSPHDHGGASGSFTVVRGTLSENFRYPRGVVQRGVRRAGETVAFGADRAHVVANAGIEAALSVHAYSPPLMPTREYSSLAELSALPARESVAVEVP
jgi:predicted metal-dependent enzyme (double-stranded beta helix superfamily)